MATFKNQNQIASGLDNEGAVQAGLPRYKSVSFSSQGTCPAERFDLWRTLISPTFEPVIDDPQRLPDASVQGYVAEAVAFANFVTPGYLAVRDKRHIKFMAAETVTLVRGDRPAIMRTSSGSEFKIPGGGMYLRNDLEPLDLRYPTIGAHRIQAITIPTALLATLLGPQALDMRTAPISNANAIILRHWSKMVAAQGSTIDPAVLAQGTADLLGQIFGGAGSQGDGLIQSRRLLLRSIIDLNLGNPALDAAMLSVICGISVRTIQRVFEPMGGLIAYIWNRRFERAAEALADPHNQTRTIQTIAQGLGFADMTHFSAAFRRRFGVSPRIFRNDEFFWAEALTLAKGYRKFNSLRMPDEWQRAAALA
jgi:AraC-like DNA-binding protein